MPRNLQRTTGLRELANLARSQTHQGVLVRARCFAVTGGNGTRYEIVLDGHGQYAVIDVASERELAPRLDQAMSGFAAAARVRAGVFGHTA